MSEVGGTLSLSAVGNLTLLESCIRVMKPAAVYPQINLLFCSAAFLTIAGWCKMNRFALCCECLLLSQTLCLVSFRFVFLIRLAEWNNDIERRIDTFLVSFFLNTHLGGYG